MATEGATADTLAGTGSASTSFRTSFLDAFVTALERLPGPLWMAYALVLLVVSIVGTAELVTYGAVLTAEDYGRVAYIFFFIFPLAAYHYLSIGACQAWDAFRPATDLEDHSASQMRLQLSSTPARPVIVLWTITALVNVGWSLAAPVEFDLVDRPIIHVALRVVSESFWVAPIAIVLIYFVVRQLRLVARLHASVRHVDLLRPGPLHAMSRLTARSAIALIVLGAYSGIPLPGATDAAYVATLLFFSLPIIIVAAFAFVVPLRGMSRRLVAEKARMLDAIGERIHATSGALHRVVDAEVANVDDVDASRIAQTRLDGLNKALASLLQERDFIRRLPTWPWDGGTARAVGSAIALPILLFLITRVLDRFV